MRSRGVLFFAIAEVMSAIAIGMQQNEARFGRSGPYTSISQGNSWNAMQASEPIATLRTSFSKIVEKNAAMAKGNTMEQRTKSTAFSANPALTLNS